MKIFRVIHINTSNNYLVTQVWLDQKMDKKTRVKLKLDGIKVIEWGVPENFRELSLTQPCHQHLTPGHKVGGLLFKSEKEYRLFLNEIGWQWKRDLWSFQYPVVKVRRLHNPKPRAMRIESRYDIRN